MLEPSTETSALCNKCCNIDFASYFQPPTPGETGSKDGRGEVFYKEQVLGNVSELGKTQDRCAFCRLIHMATSSFRGTSRISITSVLYGRNRTRDGAEAVPAYCMHVIVDFERGRTSFFVQILADDAHLLNLSRDFRARIPSVDGFDMRQALAWIDKCRTEHGTLCDTLEGDVRGVSSSPQPVDILAIDLFDMCICKMPKESDYAALSYCWPKKAYLTLLKENRDTLSAPGALLGKMADLPGTVQDAIRCTKELQIRYLWVDALCIIQDDMDQKGDQLRQMDRVYNCALVTLVCAYPVPRDVDDPCGGFPGYNKPDAARARNVQIVKGLRLMVASPSVDEYLQRTRWQTRCWTFQEGWLSRRLLYFTPQQVYFQCPCNVYCEDTVGEEISTSAHVQPGNTIWNIKSRNPENPDRGHYGEWTLSRKPLEGVMSMILHYEYALSNYTNRDVSYPSDMLNAFDGIKVVLSDAMQTDFWQGIPEKILPFALCWQLRGAFKRRRLWPAEGSPFEPLFASWTWAGWDSGVNLNDYMVIQTYRTEAEFYIINDNAVATRLSVQPEWESMQNQRAHPSVISAFLPNIVQRQDVDASSKEWRDARILGVWTTCASFILDGTHHVLSATTNREQLWRDSTNFAIKDQFGSTAGSILLPKNYFEDSGMDWVRGEFILISRSLPLPSKLSYFDDALYDARKGWCCLNVMMIARVDEFTARRVGMGILHKEAWVRARPATTFIKLV